VLLDGLSWLPRHDPNTFLSNRMFVDDCWHVDGKTPEFEKERGSKWGKTKMSAENLAQLMDATFAQAWELARSQHPSLFDHEDVPLQ